MSVCLDEEKLFIREFERKDGTIIKINQCSVGDVGCVVWDAAIVLASYLESSDFMTNGSSSLCGQNIIELGSGTGIVGLNACCQGANAIITDLKEFVPLMDLNIKENRKILKGNISATELQWGQETTDVLPQDVILLADCIYYKESLEPLVKTIDELSGPNTNILCCYEERHSEIKIELERSFFKMIREKFTVEEISMERQDPIYRSEDIHIMKFTKKQSH